MPSSGTALAHPDQSLEDIMNRPGESGDSLI